MGIDFLRQNQYNIGLTPAIQQNNYGKKIYFGNQNYGDSFQNSSPYVLFDENQIKRMIAQNYEIKKIMSANNFPLRLNIEELNQLKEGHCKNTQEICAQIVKNLPPSLKFGVNIKNLKDAALLHDFGKVLIPPEILNKHGALTVQEHKLMDLHAQLGYELLKNTGVNKEVLYMVRYHHANLNDKNIVPDINLQILNLADKYSALTENRVYKKAMTPKQALTILYSEVKKGEIDPILFNTLVKIVWQQNSANQTLTSLR